MSSLTRHFKDAQNDILMAFHIEREVSISMTSSVMYHSGYKGDLRARAAHPVDNKGKIASEGLREIR